MSDGYTYRNHNTRDTVTYSARSARLEHLPNWECIDAPPPPSAEELAQAAEAARLAEEAQRRTAEEEAEEGAGDTAEEAPARPARSATRAEWTAYAIARGMDPTTAESMKRDQLAAHYEHEED